MAGDGWREISDAGIHGASEVGGVDVCDVGGVVGMVDGSGTDFYEV